MDTIHILVTGLASIVFALIFIFIPLEISILAQQSRGAIARAWGLNGFFTVAGGFVSVTFSL